VTTREEAIKSAAEPLADAYVIMLGLDGTSVEDAARAAWTPTGPPLHELEAGIRARRDAHHGTQARPA